MVMCRFQCIFQLIDNFFKDVAKLIAVVWFEGVLFVDVDDGVEEGLDGEEVVGFEKLVEEFGGYLEI